MASLMSRMPFLILFLQGPANLTAYEITPKFKGLKQTNLLTILQLEQGFTGVANLCWDTSAGAKDAGWLHEASQLRWLWDSQIPLSPFTVSHPPGSCSLPVASLFLRVVKLLYITTGSKRGKCKPQGWGLKVMWHHFCSVLLVKANYGFKGKGKIDVTSWWEEQHALTTKVVVMIK